MSVIRWFRAGGIGTLALLAGASCTPRTLSTTIPPMPVSRVVVWRIAEGDVISVRIYREQDLSGDSPVNLDGSAYFPGVGRLHVAGLSLDSLQNLLQGHYATFIVDATVDVTMRRNVVLYGQARAPGVYLVDPGVTVLGLLSKAGGAAGNGRTPILTLVKADGRQFTLPTEGRLAMMDITRDDAIYVQEGDFFVRNQTTLQAVALVVGVAASALSLILILTR
jgi:polysaccharide export outer membrane protein